MNDFDEGSPIDRMAMMARPAEEPEEMPVPVLKPISLRLPLGLLLDVDAFGALTGQSRNTTMINLLEAGVYAVQARLDDDSQFLLVREALFNKHSEE